MFIKSLRQVKTVQWGSQHQWDVRFGPGINNNLGPPPDPFNDWFPAFSMQQDILDPTVYDVDTAMSSFSIPQTIRRRSIQLSFFDDEDCTLERWMEVWVNRDMFGGYAQGAGSISAGLRVATLAEVVRELTVVRTGSRPLGEGGPSVLGSAGSERPDPEVIVSNKGENVAVLTVFPEGQLIFSGTSEPGVKMFTQNFAVVALSSP